MTRLRRLGTFTLAALFAAFALLAPAPLLHAHCGALGSGATLRTAGNAGPALKASTATPAPVCDDCPACTISGLSAVLAARLSVGIPAVEVNRASLPESASRPAPYLEDLRSRAPPSA